MKNKMKTEYKVCTLEQSKKLVKLGVILETEWLWDVKSNPLRPEIKLTRKSTIHYDKELYKNFIFPAPDVAELGLLLPGDGWTVCSRKYTRDNSFLVEVCYMDDLDIKTFRGSSEAQAKADALIWLIEKGYLKSHYQNS